MAAVDLAGHAEEYASLGWALVELNGKNPIGHGWQNTKPWDPATAKSLWENRTGNMGIVLGPSGVIDFELDAGDETPYLRLAGMEQGGVPPTPMYRTGSGKPHLLFRDPGGLSRRTRDGMELRAGPHQSVIPPSVHPDTGEPYRWIAPPSTTPLADPPQALLDFFATAPGTGGAGGNDAHWSSPLKGEKLGEGEGRHASLVSYLGKAVNIFDSADDLAAAAIAYSAVAHDPPYPDDVITHQAFDVWSRWREEVTTEVQAIERSLKLVTADKLEMRSVKFLWKPYLQRSAFHLLVGRKGAGKGSTLTWMAAQVTNGQLEENNTPRAVLWVATEDSFEIDVKPRFMAQGGDESLLLCVQQRVLLPQDLHALEAVCREWNVGMVVIDPIVGVLGGVDSNAEGPIVAAIGGLNQLADELDLMVIGVRHLGKNIERGMLEAVLGNVAWVNTPRAVLGIAQDEDEKVVTLEVLAGNRTRSRESFDFRLEEAVVPGLDEPVSKLIPIGNSYRSMAEVLDRGGDGKGKKYDAVRDYVIEALADGTPFCTDDLLRGIVKDVDARKATYDRVVKDLVQEGEARWIPPAKGENGQFTHGGKWYLVRP